MNNILVTGAAGLIGPQVADVLSRERDTHVYTVDNQIHVEIDAACRAHCVDAIACRD